MRGLTLDDWHNGALLDSRWTLETVGVHTTEKLWLQVHGIEGVDGLIVVGLDLSCNSRVSLGSLSRCASHLCVANSLTLWDLLETLIGGSHICG